MNKRPDSKFKTNRGKRFFAPYASTSHMPKLKESVKNTKTTVSLRALRVNLCGLCVEKTYHALRGIIFHAKDAKGKTTQRSQRVCGFCLRKQYFFCIQGGFYSLKNENFYAIKLAMRNNPAFSAYPAFCHRAGRRCFLFSGFFIFLCKKAFFYSVIKEIPGQRR